MDSDRIIKVLFNLAKNLKKTARVRIIAAVTNKRKIISLATNSVKSHPLQKQLSNNEDKICLHAEVDAINKAVNLYNSIEHCTLYVVRAKKENGKWVTGNAKPCQVCQKLIDKFKIKVVYT